MDTRLNRPTPSDREVDWNKNKVLLSKTDKKELFYMPMKTL